MKIHKYLIGVLFLFLSVYARASVEVRSVHVTTNDGIVNNSIRHIFQDSKGFIWFGTLNGLSRYDGNSFVNFRPSLKDTLSLADHRIRQISEDKNGFLWISTFAELYSCYDLKKDCFVDFTGCGEYSQRYSDKRITSNGDCWLWHKGNGCRRVRYTDEAFSSFTFTKEKGNLPSNRVNYVFEDYLGRIWIGCDQGVALVTGERADLSVISSSAFMAQSVGKRVFFLSSQGSVSMKEEGRPIREVANLSKEGTLTVTGCFQIQDDWLILTSKGTYMFNTTTYKVSRSTLLNIKEGRTQTDNRGNCWICNHTGKVWYINAKTRVVKEFQLMSDDKVGYIDRERYNIVHDSRDIIWISTYGNGLFAYNLRTEELQHFTSNINGFSHINSNFLLDIMEDRSRSIWVSSEYAGASRLLIQNEEVVRMYPEDRTLSDRSNTIRMITRLQNGDIWVGTRRGGVYTYDKELHKKDKIHYYHSNIYAVAEDGDGQLWLGSRGDGLCIGNTWYTHKAEEFSLSRNQIFSIYRDRKDRMWVGTFGGGLDLGVKTETGYEFLHFLNKTYSQKQIRVITEDSFGWMWVGTSDGVYVFQPDSLIANPDNYLEYNTRNGKLRNNEIKCLCLDSKGRMWVGTSGAGFSVCEPKQNYRNLEFEHYGTEEGLVNSMVQSIVEDKHGKLWIATEYGISRFDAENHSFQNFFFSAYGLGNVYSENSGCICEDGRIMFGSNYGLLVLNPENIQANDTVSDQLVVLTNLKINGMDIRPGVGDSPLKSSMAYTDEIRLKYYQNSLMVDFSTFDYSIEGNAKYSYKLDHYEANWSTPSPLNFASYKNLLPGTYWLRVKACNEAGVWCQKETVLKIVIDPPFWKTPLAYILYTLLIIVSCYVLFRLMRNFNALRNRIEVERQLTEYKLVFFTNISHEFRTPLTLIQGALEKIESYGKIPKEMVYSLKIMDKSTQRMLRLINQLLEFRKMQNNKLALSLEETDVIAFLYEIFLSFKDVAESKNMDFQFLPSTDSYKMFIDKGNVDKVTYNLLSNAFKYTPSNGQILFSVNVEEEDKVLIIRVADTGVGIPREKRGELFKRFMQSSFSGSSVGVGLHLSHELVNVHKGTLEYDESEGGGSVFTVSLPLDAGVYEEKDFLVPNELLNEEQEAQHLKDVLVENKLESELHTSVAPLNERKILIIEDDNDIREFLKAEVGKYFEVVAESDGISGLERARVYDADLIICDVLMPGMNGFEVTRRLKEDFNTSHIPIILLTALDSSEKRLEGVENGADAYITKPFSPKYLITRVYKLIEQREKLREKFSNDPTMVRPALCSSNKDQKFADDLQSMVEKHMHNPEFSVDELISKMGLGRTIFYRKVHGVTGYSPNKYIRVIRLKKAAELLQEGKYSVSEVCYKVGMNDPFYFSQCFKQQFGISPSVYQKGPDAGEVKESDSSSEK